MVRFHDRERKWSGIRVFLFRIMEMTTDEASGGVVAGAGSTRMLCSKMFLIMRLYGLLLTVGGGRVTISFAGGPMSETRGRILLIDDDLSLGAYLARVLRTHGQFEVTHELDAAAALRCLEAERWDLLITDIEMPGMTGLELVSQARRLAPDLPIAVVTGHATLERAV